MKKIIFLAALFFSIYCNAQSMLCGDITKSKKSESYFTPRVDNVGFLKTFDDDGNATYYVSILHNNTDDPLVHKKGAKITFESGNVIYEPEVEVKIKVSNEQYEYSVFFKISEEKAKMIMAENIVSTDIYTFHNELLEAEKIKEYFTCLYDKKQ